MIAWQFADAGMEHEKPQNKNSIDDKINDDVTNHFNTSIFLRKLYLVNFNEDIFLSQTLFHNSISQFTYSWQYFNSSDIFFLNVFFFSVLHDVQYYAVVSWNSTVWLLPYTVASILCVSKLLAIITNTLVIVKYEVHIFTHFYYK